MNISVIIPAYNGAATISETLRSLLAQTYSNWEAIIVDDGSKDNIADVVAEFSKRDNRISFVSQVNLGVSAARNTGIRLAKHEWLLFLDADDWIAAHHFERMFQKKKESPDLDAMVCGWSNVTPDGIYLAEKFSPTESDLFPAFVRYCAFAIHCCIIRKELVLSVGAFDISLNICEDWDLWQRAARTGARFGFINEVLSFYRMRPYSLSRSKERFFANCILIHDRGYRNDDRMQNAHPDYIDGLTNNNDLTLLKFYCACWCAGLFIGDEEDAVHLLDELFTEKAMPLDPGSIANVIIESVYNFICCPLTDLYKVWGKMNHHAVEFLNTLEKKTKTFGLARRMQIIMERTILESCTGKEPVNIGSTYGCSIEVSEPIADICVDAFIERIYCRVQMEGDFIGVVELPVCGNKVPEWLMKDAIAAKFAWQLLGRFYTHNVYKKNTIGDDILPENTVPRSIDELHNETGWKIFLQQLWDLPDWEMNQFYDPAHIVENREANGINIDTPTVEISAEIPDFKVSEEHCIVTYSVGGILAGYVRVPAENNLVTAQATRAAINTTAGFELCRVCVREGLVGKGLNENVSIRQRLQTAAKSSQDRSINLGATGGDVYTEYNFNQPTLLLGNRLQPTGTSSFRRSILPAAAFGELTEMATLAQEPVFYTSTDQSIPREIVYMPELIKTIPSEDNTAKTDAGLFYYTEIYDREYFDNIFHANVDPWLYTHPYEQTKYELTLSLLPALKINNALELACAEGHFTQQLAPFVNDLLAADISEIALSRAADRCRHLNNIAFRQLDLLNDPLPGKFDLIVCSEVLYYAGSLQNLSAIAEKFAAALTADGYLVMAHANQTIDEPDKPGFDWDLPYGAKVIGEVFGSNANLTLIKEISTPLYRVQLFKQEDPSNQVPGKPEPIITFIDQPAPIKPSMEDAVRWNGNTLPNLQPVNVVTNSLPILMYHSVKPNTTGIANRYQITPEAFEKQLQYLQDNDYYSAGWEDWLAAMSTRKGLPGRAIALTFDDGFMDFYEYAWPLLKKYGFTATVFIVTDLVGKTNEWDRNYLPEVPLMGWQEILELQEQGIRFGSHTASHKPLTALTNPAIVNEGASSRSAIRRALGITTNIIAYPYGDMDVVTEHLLGACGYSIGLSCKSAWSEFNDDPMSLPRIEIKDSDDLTAFINKIS